MTSRPSGPLESAGIVTPPPSSGRSIPWHRRLEARVLLAVILIAGLSLASITWVTGRVVRSHSLARARGDLTAAQAAFTHLIATRTDFAVSQTRLITALPVFRAYMTDTQLSGDRESMETMADEYRRDLAAVFCVVTGHDGRWLASPGFHQSPDATLALDRVIATAITGTAVRRIVTLDRSLFLIVSEPARFGDEVLGTLSTAYRLDDEVAGELAQITRSDVALVTGSDISGASFTPQIRDELSGVMRADANAFGQPGDVALREIGAAAYVVGRFPLADGDQAGTGTLILLEAWQPTQQFIDDISRQLLQTGAVVLAFAIGGSLLLSRRMSRPLREIADVASEIAAGHWDRRVPVHGSAEATVMAETFNGMTASLSHWHAEARRQTEQLQAAYDRHAAVTDSAHDAIVSTDAAGLVVFWNRSAETTFGYALDEAVGLPFIRLLGETCRDIYTQLVREIDTNTAGGAHTFDGDGIRRDGTAFPLDLSLAPWRVGNATYLTAIIRDTTERRRTADALQQRDAQLRQAQKMEAIGRLASGVAHDFNNALAVIHGYTEQLVSDLGESHAVREDLDEILKATQSAAALTRQLLTFSRKQALDLRVLSLAEVAANIENMLRRLLGTEAELITEFDDNADMVKADRGQLEQVIVNLTVNARDAMPDSGCVRIAVRNATLTDAAACSRLGIAPGAYVSLIVSDTGHGMDSQTAQQIFEPFFTTKAEGKGTGLGLATVYGIVTQSGGAIELETAPGRGTTFSIHLPAVVEVASSVEAIAPGRDLSRGSETILLVEDEDSVRTIVRKALDSIGYEVLEAASGLEALEVAARFPNTIHMLLTDIVMPGMNGLTLSDLLAVARPDTRVLYMSGHAADAIATHGFDPTARRFLQKPFSNQTLFQELRDALAA